MTNNATVKVLITAAAGFGLCATLACSEESARLPTSPSGGIGVNTTRSTGPLAFSSTRDGTAQIYVANADGSNATRLAAGSRPAWAPDGTRIAFQSGSSSSPEIFTIGVNGSGLRSLGKGGDPSWSPDGTRLVFHESGRNISVMNADGSGRTVIAVPGFRSSDDGLHQPTWAPDGQSIAFTANNWDYPRQIFVVKLDGAAPQVLVGGPNINEQSGPRWSRDGLAVVFTHATGAFTVRADGSGWAPALTGDAYGPDWAGDEFVFSRFLSGWGPGSPMRIFIGRGASVRQLVPDVPAAPVYWDHEPAWLRR